MLEEPTTIEAPATTEGTTVDQPVAPVEAEPTVTPEAAPEAPTFDWRQELDKVDAKELRSHPKFAGILGSELQRVEQATREKIKAESDAQAAIEAKDNLKRLAREDPATFAETWLNDDEQAEVQKQLSTVQSSIRSEIATNIGKAYHDIPEWSELTPADYEVLSRAVMNKPDDEVMPIFTSKALDLIAEHRAQRKIAEYKAKELPKEREALRQEELAKILKETDSPDLARPKGIPAGVDINGMTDEQFNEFAAKKGLKTR